MKKLPEKTVKKGFFRSFSEAKSHHVGEFEAIKFPQSLIPKGLKIICKVLRGIYTPWGYGGVGGGGPFRWYEPGTSQTY
jgi:hypothetical protein